MWPAARRPPATVGPSHPGLAWAAHSHRFVHRDEVVVFVQGRRAPNGLAGGATGRTSGRLTSSQAPAASRSDFAAGTPSTRTEPVLARSAAFARETPNRRDPGVHPLADQALRNRECSSVAHDAGSVARSVADSSCAARPAGSTPRSDSTTMATAPDTTAMSATLNTGQFGSSMKSTTCPTPGPGVGRTGPPGSPRHRRAGPRGPLATTRNGPDASTTGWRRPLPVRRR